eukprot:GILK01007074.1.p1 GENE.GILK01007074.1~~GILK01007074.1.p1  ORF type:complete len:395 (-),score=45.81 GILK01007074.1:158-1309(-)
MESHLIADLFRRADKNDDGALSLTEFINFFYHPDNVLTLGEYEELFHLIDSDGSGNIQIRELYEFFMREFEPFAGLFHSIEKSAKQIIPALQGSLNLDVDDTQYDLFVRRFLVQEAARQLHTLQKTLEGAQEPMKRTAQKHRRYTGQSPHPSEEAEMIVSQMQRPAPFIGRRHRKHKGVHTHSQEHPVHAQAKQQYNASSHHHHRHKHHQRHSTAEHHGCDQSSCHKLAEDSRMSVSQAGGLGDHTQASSAPIPSQTDILLTLTQCVRSIQEQVDKLSLSVSKLEQAELTSEYTAPNPRDTDLRFQDVSEGHLTKDVWPTSRLLLAVVSRMFKEGLLDTTQRGHLKELILERDSRVLQCLREYEADGDRTKLFSTLQRLQPHD